MSLNNQTVSAHRIRAPFVCVYFPPQSDALSMNSRWYSTCSSRSHRCLLVPSIFLQGFSNFTVYLASSQILNPFERCLTACEVVTVLFHLSPSPQPDCYFEESTTNDASCFTSRRTSFADGRRITAEIIVFYGRSFMNKRSLLSYPTAPHHLQSERRLRSKSHPCTSLPAVTIYYSYSSCASFDRPHCNQLRELTEGE